MDITVDSFYKSLNKYGEELCGDKVEIIKTADSTILILADGMGSGVKANILATLTCKILGTMVREGSSIDDCVETIISTLPVCKVRELAYSTFSILVIGNSGDGYIAEFDNPSCIFIRDRKLVPIPFEERIIRDKIIKEYRFKVQPNDCFILISDGVVHAGVGQCLNFGWTWEHVAEFALRTSKSTLSASRLVSSISDACNDLYVGRAGDDTTVCGARITSAKIVNLITGPPKNPEDDRRAVHDFMSGDAKRIVSGGTTAIMVARELDLPLKTSLEYTDPTLPPTAHIKGIELVTEGVLTLTRAYTLLKRFAEESVDEEFFKELDRDNGGSKIAKMIIEECSHLNLFVGTAANSAHQNPDLPVDLSIRINLVKQLMEIVTKIGKRVSVQYY